MLHCTNIDACNENLCRTFATLLQFFEQEFASGLRGNQGNAALCEGTAYLFTYHTHGIPWSPIYSGDTSRPSAV
jgi:hypothetical protein